MQDDDDERQREPRAIAPVLISRREAAEYLGYELKTFERYVQAEIGWIRRGRSLKTTRAELDRWVAEQIERARGQLEVNRSRQPTIRAPVHERRAARGRVPTHVQRRVELSPRAQENARRLMENVAKRVERRERKERQDLASKEK